MAFFKKLFSSKIECPRCLGKGQVDMDDLRRLNNQLKWIPGKCAYCECRGRVNQRMLSSVAVDEVYLLDGLPRSERLRLINKDPQALQNAAAYNESLESCIKEIIFLHEKKFLSVVEIAKHMISKQDNIDNFKEHKETWISYVNQVIDEQKK